jgi:hypothetical protein
MILVKSFNNMILFREKTTQGQADVEGTEVLYIKKIKEIAAVLHSLPGLVFCLLHPLLQLLLLFFPAFILSSFQLFHECSLFLSALRTFPPPPELYFFLLLILLCSLFLSASCF